MLEVKDNAFYSLQEIYHGLGITIFSLRTWIKDGKLKARKTGVKYFIQGKDLKDFLNFGTSKAKPKAGKRKK